MQRELSRKACTLVGPVLLDWIVNSCVSGSALSVEQGLWTRAVVSRFVAAWVLTQVLRWPKEDLAVHIAPVVGSQVALSRLHVVVLLVGLGY